MIVNIGYNSVTKENICKKNL